MEFKEKDEHSSAENIRQQLVESNLTKEQPGVLNQWTAKIIEEIENLDDFKGRELTRKLPWFMTDGVEQPTGCNDVMTDSNCDPKLFPEDQQNGDRIVEQLMYFPPDSAIPSQAVDYKKIFVHGGLGKKNTQQNS